MRLDILAIRGGVLHGELRHCVKPASPGFTVGKRLCLRRHRHVENPPGAGYGAVGEAKKACVQS